VTNLHAEGAQYSKWERGRTQLIIVIDQVITSWVCTSAY